MVTASDLRCDDIVIFSCHAQSSGSKHTVHMRKENNVKVSKRGYVKENVYGEELRSHFIAHVASVRA